MTKTKISPKFQVVVPKEIRRQLNLHKGQEMIAMVKDGAVVYIPDRPLSELRGFLKGLDTGNIRDEDDRL